MIYSSLVHPFLLSSLSSIKLDSLIRFDNDDAHDLHLSTHWLCRERCQHAFPVRVVLFYIHSLP